MKYSEMNENHALNNQLGIDIFKQINLDCTPLN